MIDIKCPGCNNTSTFDEVRRTADEFCRWCDYPLFWVNAAGSGEDPLDDNDVSKRRLPGTGGLVSVAHRPCPTCGEQNYMKALRCIRCKGLMDPAPPPPHYVPPPPPIPIQIVEVKQRWKWWPLVISGSVMLIALIIILLARS